MSNTQFIILATLIIIASLVGGAVGGSLFKSDVLTTDTLEVQHFTLVDQNGDPKIVMTADAILSSLKMYGSGGNPRLFMQADSLGTTMVMYGEGREHQLSLGTYAYGTGMHIQNVRGRTMFRIPWAAPPRNVHLKVQTPRQRSSENATRRSTPR